MREIGGSLTISFMMTTKFGIEVKLIFVCKCSQLQFVERKSKSAKNYISRRSHLQKKRKLESAKKTANDASLQSTQENT